MEIVQHVSDESLVRYAMHPLPDAEAGPLEEHLLICLECRDRLQAEIEFVTALSGAAAVTREQERKEVHWRSACGARDNIPL